MPSFAWANLNAFFKAWASMVFFFHKIEYFMYIYFKIDLTLFVGVHVTKRFDGASLDLKLSLYNAVFSFLLVVDAYSTNFRSAQPLHSSIIGIRGFPNFVIRCIDHDIHHYHGI